MINSTSEPALLTAPPPGAQLTYSGSISKADFVAEMQAHAAADRLITGSYGWNDRGMFRGCAVGCGVETINRRLGKHFDYGNHQALANALGWPLWLVWLEDQIFEGLSKKERDTWPVTLPQAVPESADLTPALGRILSRMLREVVLPVAGNSAVVVERVAVGWETGWAHDSAESAEYGAWALNTASAAAARAAAAAARAWIEQEEKEVWAAAETAASASRAAGETEEERRQAYTRIAAIVLEELQSIPDGVQP